MGRISEADRQIVQAEIDRLNQHVGKKSVTAQDVAMMRILQNILDGDILPWEKSFEYAPSNALSAHVYTGINRILLDEGEYITMNQLLDYNKKNNTHFRLSEIKEEDDFWTKLKKSRYIIVHYNVKKPRAATKKEIAAHLAGQVVPYLFQDDKTGEFFVTRPATMSYYGVYNTDYIFDILTGEQFPHHNLQKNKRLLDGEAIVDFYAKHSGVKILYDVKGRCFFRPSEDAIHMSPLNTFKGKAGLDPSAEYYSTVFHEMGHSTGMPNRLNRKSFEDYTFPASVHTAPPQIVYSMEELVAEFTSALVLSELNIPKDKIDRTLQNNASYIDGWFSYLLKDDKRVERYYKCTGFEKMIYAIREAEKAYTYIMTGVVNRVQADEGIE